MNIKKETPEGASFRLLLSSWLCKNHELSLWYETRNVPVNKEYTIPNSNLYLVS